MNILNKDIKIIKSVGEKALVYLKNDNKINTCLDLLCCYPSDYDIVSLTNELNYQSGQIILISGFVNSALVPIKLKSNLQRYVFDLIIKNSSIKVAISEDNSLRYNLVKGMEITIYGKYFDNYKLFIVKELFPTKINNYIISKYECKNITSKTLKKYLINLFDLLDVVDDELTEEKKVKFDLINKYTFYKLLHFPKTINDLKNVSRRYKYDYYVKLIKKKPQIIHFKDANEVVKILRSQKNLFNKFLTHDEELALYINILKDIDINQTK